MPSRNLPAWSIVLVGLVFALLFGTGALLAEEKSSSSAEPAYPLAAALGIEFVDGSTSSVVLERETVNKRLGNGLNCERLPGIANLVNVAGGRDE